MADDDNLTYVEASCHCEINCFSVAFETAKLPISTDLCHCSTCRHATGQLGVEHVGFEGVPMRSAHPGGRRRARCVNGIRARSRSPSPLSKHSHNTHLNHSSTNGGLLAVPTATAPAVFLNEPVRHPFDLNDLIAYKSSPDVTRYFCHSCSAHLFWVNHVDGKDRWSVAIGALDEVEGIAQIGYHAWVGDTLDGGLADHITTIDGVKLPRYKEGEGSEQLLVGWKAPQLKSISAESGKTEATPERLLAHCHCRKITFALTRPSPHSFEPSRQYPDVLYAHDVTHISKINNPRDEKWWLRDNFTRYLAGHCMCSFCRLCSGFEIQSWGFIPLCNLVDPQTGNQISLVDQESRPKGLRQYISSPGKYRESCDTCGASIFWWDENMFDLVDVSLGLFDEAADGARAEGWFSWQKDRVSHTEIAMNRSLATGLEEGLKATKSVA